MRVVILGRLGGAFLAVFDMFSPSCGFAVLYMMLGLYICGAIIVFLRVVLCGFLCFYGVATTSLICSLDKLRGVVSWIHDK